VDLFDSEKAFADITIQNAELDSSMHSLKKTNAALASDVAQLEAIISRLEHANSDAEGSVLDLFRQVRAAENAKEEQNITNALLAEMASKMWAAETELAMLKAAIDKFQIVLSRTEQDKSELSAANVALRARSEEHVQEMQALTNKTAEMHNSMTMLQAYNSELVSMKTDLRNERDRLAQEVGGLASQNTPQDGFGSRSLDTLLAGSSAPTTLVRVDSGPGAATMDMDSYKEKVYELQELLATSVKRNAEIAQTSVRVSESKQALEGQIDALNSKVMELQNALLMSNSAKQGIHMGSKEGSAAHNEGSPEKMRYVIQTRSRDSTPVKGLGGRHPDTAALLSEKQRHIIGRTRSRSTDASSHTDGGAQNLADASAVQRSVSELSQSSHGVVHAHAHHEQRAASVDYSTSSTSGLAMPRSGSVGGLRSVSSYVDMSDPEFTNKLAELDTALKDELHSRSNDTDECSGLIDELTTQISSLEHRVSDLTSENYALKSQNSNMERLEQRLRDIDADKTVLKTMNVSLIAETQSLRSQLNRLVSEESGLRTERDNLKTENKNFQYQSEGLISDSRALKEFAETLNSENSQLRSTVSQLGVPGSVSPSLTREVPYNNQSRLSDGALVFPVLNISPQGARDGAEQQLAASNREVASLKSRLAAAQTEMHDLYSRLFSLQMELAVLHEQVTCVLVCVYICMYVCMYVYIYIYIYIYIYVCTRWQLYLTWYRVCVCV
jgi:chromosome segregation ATPase